MDNNEQNGVQTGTQTIDYEKEFKALQVKYNSLNDNYMKKSDAFDKVSSEVADFKRQQRDNMSEAQKQAEAQKELMESVKRLEAENANFKKEKEILANGFTTEECEKLMKGDMAVSVFAEILKTRLEENTKSVKANLIKESTPKEQIGDNSAANTESDFLKFQKEQQKKEIGGRVEFNKK